jgi:Reverse transcriptase (RNA-dependent DNA polymerase)
MASSLVKHKARLVARGFTQIPGIDYNEAYLYAPVMRLESFRILISIAALFDLDLRQFDVSAAYLHGEIDGEVYMDPPPGYGNGESVWLLLKGLYGLKQAGRIWHEQLKADMEGLGYVQCPRDHAVFRIGTWRNDDWAVCAFWVDDETGVGARYQLDRVAEMFRQKYGITGEGSYAGRWASQ